MVEILSTSFSIEIVALSPKGTGPPGTSHYQGAQVHWIQQRKYSGSIGFIRGFFEWIYSYRLLCLARKIRSDLYIVSVPSMFLLPLASATLATMPLVADLRDLVWDYLPSKTWVQSLIKSALSYWMRCSLQNYPAITVTTQCAKDSLAEFIESGNVTVAENGISKKRFESIRGYHHVPPEQPFIVTCVGNLGACLHLDTLLAAVEGLSGMEVQVIGDGNEQKKLESIKDCKGLKNITFHGQRDWVDLQSFYERTHLLYLQVHPNFKTSRPVRLYEYLATGLPILLAGNGECREFVSDFENITVIEPLNPEILRTTLLNLSRKPFKRSSRNSEVIGKKYIRQTQCQDYLTLVQNLLRE